jgi:teichuronic acid exporter
MDNLKERTLTGLIWNMMERVGVRIVQFIPTIILARLLSPGEFGLIGMVTIFIVITQIFLDSGFGLALIQKKDATYTDECSIFYFNILVGGLAFIALFFAAPLVAAFYEQPILTPLMRWLSLDILITSASLIQITILTRKIDFKSLLKANLLATIVGGLIGILAAYLGFGVWSLVLQTISNTVIQTITLWLVCDWRPAWLFSLDALRGMFGFGSRMLSSNLVGSFFDNLYQVFIGKVFSAESLGYYTRAFSLRSIVIDTTSDTIGRVLFPALASIQDNTTRLKQAYRKSILLTTFIHFPLMAGLILVARPLILTLFSAKWEESVIFFQLMCGAGIIYPLHVINLNILKVTGRSDLFFRLEVIKRTLIVVNIWLTYPYGIRAMLAGNIILTLLAYLLNSYYSKQLIGYSMPSQIRDFLPALGYTVTMALGMGLAGRLLPSQNTLIIGIVQSLAGMAIYIMVSWVFRSEALADILAIARGFNLRNIMGSASGNS